MSTIWRLENPAVLVDREWEGEIIVMNTLAGDTHLLEPVAAFVYRLLQGGAQSEATLAKRLAVDLDPADVGDARALVNSTLLEFSRLGLIASAPVENR